MLKGSKLPPATFDHLPASRALLQSPSDALSTKLCTAALLPSTGLLPSNNLTSSYYVFYSQLSKLQKNAGIICLFLPPENIPIIL